MINSNAASEIWGVAPVPLRKPEPLLNPFQNLDIDLYTTLILLSSDLAVNLFGQKLYALALHFLASLLTVLLYCDYTKFRSDRWMLVSVIEV